MVGWGIFVCGAFVSLFKNESIVRKAEQMVYFGARHIGGKCRIATGQCCAVFGHEADCGIGGCCVEIPAYYCGDSISGEARQQIACL